VAIQGVYSTASNLHARYGGATLTQDTSLSSLVSRELPLSRKHLHCVGLFPFSTHALG